MCRMKKLSIVQFEGMNRRTICGKLGLSQPYPTLP